MKPRIRHAKDADMAYVVACWSRDAFDLVREKPPQYTLFSPLFGARVTQILKRATVLVAVNSEDDDQIYGCVVFEKSHTPVLHYVTVKYSFRRHGLARILLHEAGLRPNKPVVYSLPPKPRRLAPKQWTYVPYGLMP